MAGSPLDGECGWDPEQSLWIGLVLDRTLPPTSQVGRRDPTQAGS